MNKNKMPIVFISYSWEEEEHQKWVEKLAEKLSLNAIDAIFDRRYLELGDRITEFMEKGISVADYVLIVCTPTYKEKANKRDGGVV